MVVQFTTVLSTPSVSASTVPITNFLSCDLPTSMNCIVSIQASFPDGHSVYAVKTEHTNSWESKDFEGNIRQYSAQEWVIQGMKSSAGTNTIVTQFWMQNPIDGPTGTDYGALDMTIFASLFDSPQEKINSPLCLNTDLLSPCIYPAQLQPDIKFTVVLNSNLIQPSFTTGSVQNAIIVQHSFGNGSQFTISGSAMKIPINLPNAKGTAPGDFLQALDDRYYWHLYTLDARNPQFNWGDEQKCSIGNPVISSNAASAGLPSFDKNTREINLQVASPHLSADGIHAEVGTFQASLPLAGIACLWGVNLKDLSTEARISVTYSDGTAESAVLTTSISGDKFLVKASGYHYSTPIIHFGFSQLQSPLQPLQGTVTSKVVINPKTLVCKKGRLLLRVKNSAPKCPKGYLAA